MKLNVCCGRHILEGWVNVDVAVSTHPKAKGRVPEILADARSIPLDSDVADEVLMVHGFEHFFRFESDDVLRELKRLLKPGGKLILELPDIIKCCENLIRNFTVSGKHPDQYGMWGIYGDPTTRDPFMTHKWGWSPQTLRAILVEHGFIDITDEAPEWHAAGAVRRDMRITARKAHP